MKILNVNYKPANLDVVVHTRIHLIDDKQAHAPADLDEIVRLCTHLENAVQTKLKTLLKKYQHLFDGTLGV